MKQTLPPSGKEINKEELKELRVNCQQCFYLLLALFVLLILQLV